MKLYISYITALISILSLLLAASPVSAVSVNADLSACEDQPECRWSFGEGENAMGCRSMSHQFSKAGKHQVQLTVDCGQFTQKVTRTVNVGTQGPMKSCQDHLKAGHTESGVYKIDPDGEGGQEPFKAYCDQKTDGGGWMLVLNYLHKGGTNPSLNVRSDSLPLQGDTTLGTDESGTKHWGHASNSMFSELPVDEVRFFCQTSKHGRKIHFSTIDNSTIDYFSSGIGDTNNLSQDFRSFKEHTGYLPENFGNSRKDKGNYAMTNHTFYDPYNYHWNIRTNDNRWECDDWANSAAHDTHHQVWVR